MIIEEPIAGEIVLMGCGQRGYVVAHGQHLLSTNLAAERELNGDLALTGRLHEMIRQRNPATMCWPLATLQPKPPREDSGVTVSEQEATG